MPPAVIRFACHAADAPRAAVLTLPDGTAHELALPDFTDDDEHTRVLNPNAPGETHLVLRRVGCSIECGLLARDAGGWELSPQTRAALLWRAFRRYDRLAGVRRVGGGLSGSDVLVFHPRLRAPNIDAAPDAGPLRVLREAWGTPLLVKCGPEGDIRREWTRAETFLRDRQTPFLVRYEEPLDVYPVGPRPGGGRATAFSAFLGGDVVRAEPLDKLVRGTRDADRAARAIDAVVGHLAAWHANPQVCNLAEWSRVFRFESGAPPEDWPARHPDARWLAFGRFNFRKETAQQEVEWDMPRSGGGPSLGRNEFRAGAAWDSPFAHRAHLEGHLLGPVSRRDGLLYRLSELPALFSLVHGDLNPRNVLCDADRAWLIDFEKTGVGPVLADLAMLEVNMRLWCIRLGPMTDDASDAVRRLEFLLLDHLYGGECSLEPVRAVAAALGADPDDLEKFARCVVHLRRLGRRWCVPQFADARDYLAVLYLTALSLVPVVGKGRNGASNERWLLGLIWALEETLDRVLGRTPYSRRQRPYDPLHHVSADLVRGPNVAARVHALCDTADGRLALAPVAALRGVLQGSYHHLDVYHHTLAVVAYMEALLADPVGGLLAPAALDAAVETALDGTGIASTPPEPDQRNPAAVAVPWGEARLSAVRALLEKALTGEARQALMWCAVLHDVGKPGTRTLKDRAGGAEVQFLGHPWAGVALLRERLLAWFPGPDADTPNPVGRMLADLVRDHHTSHELLQYLFEQWKGVRPVTELDAALTKPHAPEVIGWLAERTDPHDNPHLPLLLLHGYADRLASRGRRQGHTVTETAGATLSLLAFLADRPALVETYDTVRLRPAAAQAARRSAAEGYAAELLGPDRPRDAVFGCAMVILMNELADRDGTPAELTEHLRRVIGRDDLTRRLGLV